MYESYSIFPAPYVLISSYLSDLLESLRMVCVSFLLANPRQKSHKGAFPAPMADHLKALQYIEVAGEIRADSGSQIVRADEK